MKLFTKLRSYLQNLWACRSKAGKKSINVDVVCLNYPEIGKKKYIPIKCTII